MVIKKTIKDMENAAIYAAMGFEIGEVRGFNDIEIIGEEKDLQYASRHIDDFECNANELLKKYGFIKYLAKRR